MPECIINNCKVRTLWLDEERLHAGADLLHEQ